MPREKMDNPMQAYTIMLEPDTIEELKQEAEKADIPPRMYARRLVKQGLKNAKRSKKGGQ